MRAAALVITMFLSALLGCAGQPGSAGKPVLVDTKTAPKLYGAQWELKTLTVDGTRVIMHPDAPMFITFGPDGKVAGAGPVNQFQGGYTFSADGRLSWASARLATTRKAGAPELMDKERAYFSGLPKTTRAVLAGDALQLQSEDGNTVLAFTRM
jgi:heat shock protein HslJ